MLPGQQVGRTSITGARHETRYYGDSKNMVAKRSCQYVSRMAKFKVKGEVGTKHVNDVLDSKGEKKGKYG